MDALQTPIIRTIILFLLAAGLTVGIPALLPGGKERKYYYLGWIVSAAVIIVFLLLAYYGNIYVKCAMTIVIVCVISVGNRIIDRYEQEMTSYKGQSCLSGGTAGTISGMLIAVGAETFLPVSDLVKSDEIVPAIIVLIVYFFMNCFFSKRI